MQKGGFTRWFLVWFLAVILLLCVSLGIRVAATTGKAGSTSVTAPRLLVITALRASGPHPFAMLHSATVTRPAR